MHHSDLTDEELSEALTDAHLVGVLRIERMARELQRHRAAKQLAGAGLSDEDKQVLCWLFGRATDDAILGKSGGHGMMDFQLLTDARTILLRLTGGKP